MPEVLSESECAVSRALFAGLNNAEIAAVRGTAVKTVANQLNSAYHKLGVRSRDQLVARLLGLE
nr:helix-turn-helix transcriptional regulator [Pseudenhygromyxa sp. WMMC2535]